MAKINKIMVQMGEHPKLRFWHDLGINEHGIHFYCRAVKWDVEQYLQLLLYQDKKLIYCPSYYPASLLGKGSRFLSGLEIKMDEPDWQMSSQQTVKMLIYANSIWHLEKPHKKELANGGDK